MVQFYQQQGPSAWEKCVPYTVTNSTATANFHAHTILQHIISLENMQSYSIIDYGAGIGQHGWLLANAISRLAPSYHVPIDKITIILADISADTMTYLRQHPQMQQHIQSGLITLTQLSGAWLADISKLTKDPKTSYCLIANYLLDSMPVAAFAHQKQQGLKLLAPRKHLHSGEFKGSISDLTLKFTELNPATPLPYEDLCDRYKQHAYYTLPITAIDFLKQFFSQQTDRLMIINDKGYAQAAHLDYDHTFNLVIDGCYSSSVNFDAIITATQDELHHQMPCNDNPHLQTHIFSNQPLATSSSPNCSDIAALISHYKQLSQLCAPTALAIIKTLQYDPFALEIIGQAIEDQPHRIHALTEAINTCLENHYKKPKDFIDIHIARLYRKCNALPFAKKHLDNYINNHPEHPAYLFELALFHIANKETDSAQPLLEKVSSDLEIGSQASDLLDKIKTENKERETK